MFSRSSGFLAAALSALLAISVARAQSAARVTPGMLPDGAWTVEGREIPGTRCGHWLVRLTSRQGRLSGVVSLARGSVPIQNPTVMADGSFSGTTQAGVVGARFARAYRVSGRFFRDSVSLTLENDICPARHGTAARQAARR